MELLGTKPDRKVILYFISIILSGTLLLLLPVSSTGKPVVFVDALFTATSAVCVTGLTVLDTGGSFSLFGQVVILLLIQLGGLGIMTFTTMLLISMFPRISFQDRLVITQTLGGDPKAKTGALLKAVFLTTLSIELTGAVALFFRFKSQMSCGRALFYSVFHSVSAFCNAGFSLFSNSLESYSHDLYAIGVFSLLIISGGLGFIVIRELFLRSLTKKNRLSLHSKLCLSVTGFLILAGTAAFLLAEYRNVYSEMGVVHSLANAFFQAVTSRTAGFNTITQTNLTEVSLLVTIILMFIGACPGSTGGGVKTTTFGIIFLMACNRFMGRRSVKAFNRSVSDDSIHRALTVMLAAMAVIVLVFVLLMFAEEEPLPHHLTYGWFVESLFEVISAFGTVGLSLGTTSQLHEAGKILIIILMFIGRVGLLTLVYNLARPTRPGEIVYLDEQVMVG